jgi:hypothetical protein
MFPTGAATDSEHVRFAVQETGTALPTNADAVLDFLGQQEQAGATPIAPLRTYPGITLRAGEYARISLYNGSGGALNDQIITANYRVGQHQSDVGRP